MPKLRIDNLEVEVPAGATVLEAAQRLGIDIPNLCWYRGCEPQTSCLACVVKVNGGGRLVPSCATRAADGMVVESESEEVRAARRMALELLLADHAGDCLAPCQGVCPAHMDIPTMIRQIQAGEYREALITVKQAIALPAVLGRICPELCEKGCRRAARDSAVSICNLKRFVADTDLASPEPWRPQVAPPSGKRVAIVGTGPAGLAAAYYLLQMGHACVLFDEHPEAGGNLRYAIDERKLPRSVLDAEIGLIRTLGAEFRLGVRIGADLSMEQVQREFDAVLLAVGEMDGKKAAALGIEMAGNGVKVDRHTFATALPGVFAAGAMVAPTKHAVRSVGDGREAARIIHEFVSGQALSGKHIAFSSRLGVLRGDELTSFMSTAQGDGRLAPTGGGGFDADQAVAEASRCMSCDCGKLGGCRLRHYAEAYRASPGRYRGERRPFERVISHPAVVYEPGKCIACGLCVQITSRQSEPLGLTYVGRGFSVRIGVPFNEKLSAALQKVAAECIAACPTGALAANPATPAPAGARISLIVLKE